MIQIYNTLTRKKEEFAPGEGLPAGKAGKKVQMFVCGPTVYDYIHIGNARTFTVFDAIAKYLRHRGYELNYIQNITDIDDRIIKRARESGQNWKELAEKFEKIFLENMKDLKVSAVDKYPRATDHIPEIIKQVETLIEKGHAYKIENDGYYFDLKTFPEYGRLSGRTVEMAEDAISHIDESSDKRNRGDFCLWKLSRPRADVAPALGTKLQVSGSKAGQGDSHSTQGNFWQRDGEPSWPSELGEGRPGWHIEDTAITEKYFGPQYDIHGGGQDLMFPHHEAEITQQASAAGIKPEDFVKYWMHAGFLVNKTGKMSKSFGDFIILGDALKKYSPEVLRFYFFSAHYRSPLDYTEDNLKQAEAAVNRLGEFTQKLKLVKNGVPADNSQSEIADLTKKFEESMDDDFNIPAAMGHIFSFIADVNPKIGVGKISQQSAQAILEFLGKINDVLGILPTKVELPPPEVQKLIDEREAARKQEDFTRADQLRKQIKNLGYEVDDTIYGPLIKKSG